MQLESKRTKVFKRLGVTLIIAATAVAFLTSVNAQRVPSGDQRREVIAEFGQKGQPESSFDLNSSDNLEGTWIFKVDSGPGIPQIVSLHTYTAGGGMIESNSTDQQPPVQFAGQGTWVKIGRNRFASTFLKFQYDAAGNVVGSLKVRRTFRLKRDTITGEGEVLICDPNFENCFSVGTSTETGKRMNVELPGQ